ncbi:MAG: methyltransferase domain-containing protein [Candidatus Nanoarchaeia archaeon]
MSDEYYNSIAEGYNELYEEEQIKKWNFVKSWLNFSNKTVLDVGCGTGIITYEIYKLGGKITGLDSSKKMLALAKNLKSGPNYVLGYAENLPFPDNSFDYVVSCTMLQDVEDKNKVLHEINRVCKDYAIVSILKKEKNAKDIKKLIEKYLKIIKFAEEEKDFIFLCKPNKKI